MRPHSDGALCRSLALLDALKSLCSVAVRVRIGLVREPGLRFLSPGTFNSTSRSNFCQSPNDCTEMVNSYVQ